MRWWTTGAAALRRNAAMPRARADAVERAERRASCWIYCSSRGLDHYCHPCCESEVVNIERDREVAVSARSRLAETDIWTRETVVGEGISSIQSDSVSGGGARFRKLPQTKAPVAS